MSQAELTREELIRQNLELVETHFHNENPEDVDKAIALYADNIVWEAPSRGQVYTSAAEVKAAYLDIFRSIHFNKTTALHRFATENYVFDDMIADVTLVGDYMPNMPFPVGTRMSVRITHIFYIRNNKIEREIAYEIWRKADGDCDHDSIPAGSQVEIFDAEACAA